jgi:hypothetical protein
MKPARCSIFPFFILHISLITTLCGCSTLLSGYPRTEIPTGTNTPLPTATTAWFPPTVTPTRFIPPTSQPTTSQLEDVGPLTFSDDFTEKTAWQVGDKPSGSVEYNSSRLTLAIQQPKGYIFSFRPAPSLQNAYVEITTSTSLCMGNDAYGFLFRASSIQDFYRFLVNCNGLFRLERVRSGVVNTLVDWTTSSQLSAGAPLTLRLGVWMKGKSIRIFINQNLQAEATDDAFSSGWLGVFTRSAGNTAVTVNFSDLQVHALASDLATPSATP